jgi:hypothetical protein
MTSLMRDWRQGEPHPRFSAMKKRNLTYALAAALSLAAPGAVSAGADGPPTVVELFTSQSCYSCPPAEAFLGELAQQPSVIALEFHVDYWDDLVYGLAGRWKDVYSSPAYTRRQRSYNQAIKGKPTAYTPQMVIDGSREAVGNRRNAVQAAIEAANQDTRPRAQVSITPGATGGLTVALEGAAQAPTQVWLARFILARTTQVQAGENNGKSLTNHHVVTELRQVGQWSGGAARMDLPEVELGPEEGCAILVQDGRPGPILGAATCPRPSS